MNSVVINLSSTTIPQDPANMTLIPTVAAATVGMVDTSSFQVSASISFASILIATFPHCYI